MVKISQIIDALNLIKEVDGDIEIATFDADTGSIYEIIPTNIKSSIEYTVMRYHPEVSKWIEDHTYVPKLVVVLGQ